MGVKSKAGRAVALTTSVGRLDILTEKRIGTHVTLRYP